MFHRPVSLRCLAFCLVAASLMAAEEKSEKKEEAKPEEQTPGKPKGRLAWRPLCNGKDLSGWSIDAKGRWSVEDGAIVGRQDLDTRGESWLFTDEEFGDFALVLTFEITKGGNSGIALRIPRVPGSPAHLGYEMQIWDADPDYPTGSFWGLPKANAPAGLQIPDKPNQVTICCVGDLLFTSVNDRVGVAIKNRRRAKGRIGFQVHGGIEYKDAVVRFRDIWLAPLAAPTPAPSGDVAFKKIKLDPGAHEAAAVFDVNRDRRLDIVCGERWYENPMWAPQPARTIAAGEGGDIYALPCDVNNDGYTDAIAGSASAKKDFWHENPGKAGRAWTPHEFLTRRDPIGAMFLLDLDGDGLENDLLPNGNGSVGWIHIAWGAEPTFTPRELGKEGLGHGIGYGDVNGDKRRDILTATGWWEAPADPAKGRWTWHPEFKLKVTPGTLRTFDVNGDGKPDIVYGNAQGYGLWWLEQGGEGGKRTWTEHLIDDSFSQVQAIEFADLNGDGRPEVVTGRRWRAGSALDEGECEPTCLFWFERDGKGEKWTRHILDYNGGAGCGMGLSLYDLNGDGRPDIVAPGKGGLYLFLNQGKK